MTVHYVIKNDGTCDPLHVILSYPLTCSVSSYSLLLICFIYTQICQKDVAINNTYYVIGTLKTEMIMINGSDMYVSYNDTGATTVYNRYVYIVDI